MSNSLVYISGFDMENMSLVWLQNDYNRVFQ